MPDTKIVDLCVPLEQGDQIVFTQNNMGCTNSPNSSTFNEYVVNEGDFGLYECPHPTIPKWHICTHKVDENMFVFVPLHRMCFMKREGR